MIVKMLKVTLLCLARDTDRTLTGLQQLGVLHLTHVMPPEGDDLTHARERLEQTEDAITALRAAAASDTPPADNVAPVDDIAALPDHVTALLSARDKRDEQRAHVVREIGAQAPFGDFDVELARTLTERGIGVRLFQIPGGDVPPVPEGCVLQPLSHTREGVYVAVVGPTDAPIDSNERPLPEQSLGTLRKRLEDLDRNRQVEDAVLAALAARYVSDLESYAETLRERVGFAEARAGMGREERLTYLQGFCPVDRYDALRRQAAEHGLGLVSEEPEAEESVPTLLRYPPWTRPIRAVFDGLGILPGYDEQDVGSAFLVFFSLFFGMLVGDAGYGLIFLVLTLAARARIRTFTRQAFWLLIITSAATIAWGTLTGTWFGIENLPGPFREIHIPWLENETNLMALCFLIGAVHLTVAHAWVAWHQRRSPRALAQVGWILSTWMMYFIARWLVLGYTKPDFLWPLVGVAALLIALFMTPVRRLKTDWFGHAMLPLDMIGNFVDVVSYVRLFAVGAASLAVARSFNTMAVGGGVDGVLAAIGAALVLFIGHALNIAMAIMGVMVHGIRLNTLEFSSHMGVEWKGFAYRPFASQHAPAGDAAQEHND